MSSCIIGLTGHAGSGKDTVAAMLEQLVYGNELSCERIAFAGHLKRVLGVLFEPFGISEDVFHDREHKEIALPGFDVSPRLLMQSFGTDFVRDQIRKDFWLSTARAIADRSEAEVVIFTDVRFDNEAELVRSMGGVVIHLVGRTSVAEGITAGHASEHGVVFRDNDLVVSNEGTMDALAAKVVTLFWTRLIWKAKGVESYCQQICGGGECGTGDYCQYGIDPDTHLPHPGALEDVA